MLLRGLAGFLSAELSQLLLLLLPEWGLPSSLHLPLETRGSAPPAHFPIAAAATSRKARVVEGWRGSVCSVLYPVSSDAESVASISNGPVPGRSYSKLAPTRWHIIDVGCEVFPLPLH
ncbi:hypothetical protein AOXY_G20412 [Acipenser oxyrinchus oxyrinchus]|uniref:Secreted protein n=1 Tax=Acipenser oxyrinchus oxyrinchus TaxID=40147 RepID=A0AAD8D0R9_ACIOX|nr:hypothetical protein AOXY_G20412 [Acipenser oxyrinchus oxyrinchus]